MELTLKKERITCGGRCWGAEETGSWGGRVQTEEAGKGDEIQTIRRGRGLDDGVPTDLCPH